MCFYCKECEDLENVDYFIIFLPGEPKVPHLHPAPDRKGCIFGLVRQKNSIRTTEENKECLRSVCLSPEPKASFTLNAIWDILYFYSLSAQYTITIDTLISALANSFDKDHLLIICLCVVKNIF